MKRAILFLATVILVSGQTCEQTRPPGEDQPAGLFQYQPGSRWGVGNDLDERNCVIVRNGLRCES